jgi:hypothetical protein
MNACREKIRKKNRFGPKIRGAEKDSREAAAKTYLPGRLAGGGPYRRPHRRFGADFRGGYFYPFFGKKPGGVCGPSASGRAGGGFRRKTARGSAAGETV